MQSEAGFVPRLAKSHVLALLAPLAASCATFQPVKVIDPQELTRGTYVISAPGRYRLGGDAIAGGLADGSPAIRVAADDVTLDLGGHALSMPPAPAGASTGIEINGVSNATVTNGSLREFGGAGIFLVCDVEPPARRCANFSFTRLDLRNVGKAREYRDLGSIFVRPFSGGIVVFGRSTPVPVVGGEWDNSITGLTVSGVSVRNDPDLKHLFSGSPPAGGQNGLTFASVSNLRVEDTSVAGMASNDAAACIFLGRTKAVVVRRFNCSGATGDRNANGLDSMANVLKPLAIKKNYDVRVEDSSFSNIRATGARGNEALGVELNGEKFIFDDLLVADVINESTTADGNRAIGIQIVFNEASKEVSRISNCTVRNVTHHGAGRDSRAGGVSIEAAPPIVVRGCSVSNVANVSISATSIKAFGYRVDPGTNKVTLEENSSDNVTAPAVARPGGPIPGYVAGFALVGAEVEMSGNRSSRSQPGLYARKLAPDSSIRNNRFECNRVGIDDTGGARPYLQNRLSGNATATAPAGLLQGPDNVISAAGCRPG
jgi:hypothetical protein